MAISAALLLSATSVGLVSAQIPTEPNVNDLPGLVGSVQEGAAYLLDPTACLASPTPVLPGTDGSLPVWENLKVALCKIGQSGNPAALNELEQLALIQNPVRDGGFQLGVLSDVKAAVLSDSTPDSPLGPDGVATDFVPGWTYDDSGTGTASVGSDGVLALTGSAFIKQYLYSGDAFGQDPTGILAGQGVLGSAFGMDSLSIDVFTGTVHANVKLLTAGGNEILLTWQTASPGRAHFTVPDAVCTYDGGSCALIPGPVGATLQDLVDDATLAYLTIYSDSGATVDNVVIDGTCVGASASLCIEWDSAPATATVASLLGGPLQPLGDALLNPFAHDGYGVLVVPFNLVPAAADPLDPTGLTGFSDATMQFWVGAVRYTPSGAELVDASEVRGATLLATPAPGAAGLERCNSELLSANCGDQVLALGAGAFGAVYAQAWGSENTPFAQAAGVTGHVFSLPLTDAIANPFLYSSVKLVSSDPGFAFYDFSGQGLFNYGAGDLAPRLEGFYNDLKLDAPGLAVVGDAADLVPQPWFVGSFTALTGAGAAVAAAGAAGSAVPCSSVCDFNDNWFHVVRPMHAIPVPNHFIGSDGTVPVGLPTSQDGQLHAEVMVLPDADGTYVFRQELYYYDSGNGIQQISLDPAQSPGFFSAFSLSLNTLSAAANTVASLDPMDPPSGVPDGFAEAIAKGFTPADAQFDDGAVIYRFTYDELLASGIVLGADPAEDHALIMEPAAVWSNIWYQPRNPSDLFSDPCTTPDECHHSGASPNRSDHPGDADLTACYNGSDPYACPESGGFFSLAKNALVDNFAAVPVVNQAAFSPLMDAFEYAMTPVTASLNSDANTYMFIDTPNAFTHGCTPTVPAGATCAADYVTGQAMEYGTFHAVEGQIQFWAMPYSGDGRAMGGPGTDVQKVTFVASNSPTLVLPTPLPQEALVALGSDFTTVLGEGTYDAGYNAYLMTMDEATFRTNMGSVLTSGTSTFYVYAFASDSNGAVPGYSGAYNWEKATAHYAGLFPLAAALDNVASPLVYTVGGLTATSDVKSLLIEAGTSEVATFTVHNGDVIDHLVALARSGPTGVFTDVAPPTSVMIPAGGNALVPVTVSAPASAVDGNTGALSLTATDGALVTPSGSVVVSLEAFRYDPADFTVTVLQQGFYADPTPNGVIEGAYCATPASDGCPAGAWPPNVQNSLPVQLVGTQDLGAERSAYSIQAVIHDDMKDAYLNPAGGVVELNGHTVAMVGGFGAGSAFAKLTQAGPMSDGSELLVQLASHAGGSGQVASLVCTLELPIAADYCGLNVPTGFVWDHVVNAYDGETNAGDFTKWTLIDGTLIPYTDGLDWATAHPGLVGIDTSFALDMQGRYANANAFSLEHPYAGVILPTNPQLVLPGAPAPAPETAVPVLFVPSVLDSDHDGYPNIVEVRSNSGVLSHQSTPYTDDDHDGVPNVRDNLPFLGSAQLACTPGPTAPACVLAPAKTWFGLA